MYRHGHGGDGFGLLLIAILPFILCVWIIKLIIQGIIYSVGLITAGSVGIVKHTIESKQNNKHLLDKDTDEYVKYETIFDDED